MENATKALLIAAAVLVVIILIAFGMRILNSGSGTQDQADATMNSAKAQAFNQKFEAYVGDRVSPSAVRNLFTMVAQNNQSDPTHSIEKYSDFVKKNPGAALSTNDEILKSSDYRSIDGISEVENNKTYVVRFGYENSGENAGYISWVCVAVKITD